MPLPKDADDLAVELLSCADLVKDDRYSPPILKLMWEYDAEKVASQIVLKYVDQVDSGQDGGRASENVDKAINAWNSQKKAVTTQLTNVLILYSGHAEVTRLASLYPVALKAGRAGLEKKVERFVARQEERSERDVTASTTTQSASPSPAGTAIRSRAREVPDRNSPHLRQSVDQAPSGRTPIERVLETPSQHSSVTADGRRSSTASTSTSRKAIVKIDATCFFWYHEGGWGKEELECKFYHRITEPLNIAFGPRGFRHGERDCRHQGCPVMIERRQRADLLARSSITLQPRQSPAAAQEPERSASTPGSDPRRTSYATSRAFQQVKDIVDGAQGDTKRKYETATHDAIFAPPTGARPDRRTQSLSSHLNDTDQSTTTTTSKKRKHSSPAPTDRRIVAKTLTCHLSCGARNRLCDSKAHCTPCAISGINMCVYHLCDRRDTCDSEACTLIHPFQQLRGDADGNPYQIQGVNVHSLPPHGLPGRQRR